ncbi:hypothetical protein PDIDSM_2556 [Penicillium digitatum]|nr:hypothetical protein PDIDSM_2556 [Penicillium digitatum]
MDGRNLQPEDTQPVTHNTPASIQNIAATIDGSFDPTHEIDIIVQPDNSSNLQASNPSEALNSSNEPQYITSAMFISEPRRSLDNAFDPEELTHSSLPADDGMGVLRSKIIAIRELRLTNAEKARMVHGLMTEGYNSARELPSTTGVVVFSTPSSLPSLGLPTNPQTLRASEINTSRPSSPYSESVPLYERTLTLTPEDLQPTFVPKAETESPELETGDEDRDIEEQEETTLGCAHYQRNVKLECYSCKKWYTCRFCHDAVESHPLVRRDTEHMLCMLCGHAQPAAQNCRQCNEQTAQYYCEICKLWDNDSKKSIYHCNDCGICRIGQGLGKDFFHCQTCSVCLPISIENTHRCIERSTQCDCPICGDYMFTSPDTVVVMRCGHSIHHKCLSEYSKSSYRCPLCSKTITNMESTFRNLDRTINSQPMPDEFKDTKGLIYCNDCGSKSVVKYHWLGLRCDLCESYNTAQLRILHGDMSSRPEEDAEEGGLPWPRSSSLIENDDSVSSSVAALNVNNTSVPHSRLSVPMPPEPVRQFSSYNITRGRAVSPVVSNYFGLPAERESEKTSSIPFFGGPSRGDNEDYGALNFLSKKLTDRYGLFGGEAKSTKNVLEAETEEEDVESSDSAESDGSHGTDDEEEEEDQDHIQIFGHQ